MSYRTSLLIAALAGIKALVACASILLALPVDIFAAGYPPLPVRAAVLILYSLVGMALVIGGRADARCRELGAFLLLVASPFADPLVRVGHPLGGVSALAAGTRLDAWLPACLWIFISDFPIRAHMGWAARIPDRAARASLIVGAVLFTIPIVLAVPGLPPGVTEWLSRLARSPRGSLYWPLQFLMMLAAAPILLERARHVHPAERRRVMVLATGVAFGLTPLALDVLSGDSTSRLERLATGGAPLDVVVVGTVLIGLLSVPFTTAYSVLVDQVVDLRLLARSAMRYALARHYTLVLAVLPLAGLGWVLYRRRGTTVEELLIGPSSGIILALVALALTALWARRHVLTTLDKRFFREHYDAQEILGELVTASRRAESTERLVELLSEEIDRSLHPERISVLVRNASNTSFGSLNGSTRALPINSTIVRLLGASDAPLDLEPDNPSSVLRRLDGDDQIWLADGGFRLLVPLRSTDGGVLGLLALGDKKSELPYTTQDRQLLAAVGASGGLFLEGRRAKPASLSDLSTTSPPPGPRRSDRARECAACGRVHPEQVTECTCGSVSLIDAPLPAHLAGKFHVERRIGAGGMGVVYRAFDTTLGRTVAIKTLPRTAAERTWRLRREARAMAVVTHPNLALIYGVESWHGQPLLIVEYLAGGTLADRVRTGKLPLDVVLHLGVELAQVLGALHSAELIHRDIKPSNIGFTAQGAVKLLDFGLARLRESTDDGASRPPVATDSTMTPDATGSRTDHIVGTPAYMAPEALRGNTPHPSFDLWSLAVVLVEALTGSNPFRGRTLLETVAIIEGGAPPSSVLAPETPPPLAEFLTRALARDRRRRPDSAAEFEHTLSSLLAT